MKLFSFLLIFSYVITIQTSFAGSASKRKLPKTLVKAQISLPITWNDSALVDYTTVDFGGNASTIGNDPANPSNLVLKVIKSTAAQIWAGSTLGTEAGFNTPIPFSNGNTFINTRIFSPNTSMQIRLKAEDSNDPTKSVETIAMTTVANGWEILTFNFANQAPGTAAINFGYSYNKLSIFFNFGIDGATAGSKTFFLDDVKFGEGPSSGKLKIDLPITWDDSSHIDYSTTDFAGNLSELAADPLNDTNIVLKITRTDQSLVYAGTTLGTDFGLATAMPFSATSNLISVKVYSAEVGVKVRLKVENIAGGANCETDRFTTVANQWEDITFDFTNPAAGTPPMDYSKVYNKLVIFFNFGDDGATVGNKTYFIDNVVFGTFTPVSEMVRSNQIEILPNPNSGSFQIRSNEFSNGAQSISILDMMGRSVYEVSADGIDLNSKLIQTSLPAGYYTLRISDGNRVSQSRLIVR